MAKNALAKKDDPKNLPAVPEDFFGGDDGFKNVSRDDIALPRLAILQALSPQINKRHDEYVDGAEIGQLYNTATGQIYEDFDIVFAAYERRYVEWVPRAKGGGLVADHGVDAAILEACLRNDEDGSLWHGDNELIVTGTWYGLNPNTLSPVFIAMGKTHLTASKKIMAAVRDQKYHAGEGKGFKPAPIFGREWKLGSTLRSNDKGEWFTWKASVGRWVPEMTENDQSKAVISAVREMQGWINEGRVTIDISEDDVAPTTASGDESAM